MIVGGCECRIDIYQEPPRAVRPTGQTQPSLSEGCDRGGTCRSSSDEGPYAGIGLVLSEDQFPHFYKINGFRADAASLPGGSPISQVFKSFCCAACFGSVTRAPSAI